MGRSWRRQGKVMHHELERAAPLDASSHICHLSDEPSMFRQALIQTLDDETLKILAERIEAFLQHCGTKPTPQQIRAMFTPPES